MSTEKTILLNQYLNGYTPENRLGFCSLALRKYRFENYKLSDNDIKFEDRIVQDNDVRSKLEKIVEQGECSVDDFKSVFNSLTVDQITYIGY